MGQVSSSGQYIEPNQENKVVDKQKHNEINSKKLDNMNKLLNKKKFALSKLLQLFKFYINMRILDKTFKLKNNTIILELDKENSNLETNIKKNDEKYLKNMRNLKHDIFIVDRNKKNNEILYITNIVLVIIFIILLILFIHFKYRGQGPVLNEIRN